MNSVIETQRGAFFWEPTSDSGFVQTSNTIRPGSVGIITNSKIETYQADIDEGFNISFEHVLVLEILIDGFLYEYKWFESGGPDMTIKLLSGGYDANSNG